MSYTPTTWTTGDTITATALNKIENGIASAGGGVNGLVTDTSDTLDKTYNEIMAMVSAGAIPFIIFSDGFIYRLYWIDDSDGYGVGFGYYDPMDGAFLDKVYFSSTADGQMVLD